VFLSAQCPVSNEYNGRMSTLFQEYSAKGVHLLFVNANRNESNQAVEEHRQAAGFPFHVYRDRESTLAGALGAEVTPQAFVFDRDGVLRYKGYIDDARNPARVRVQGLRNALDAVMAGKPVARPETKAFGCTIKRRKKVS
jgi:G3E family GTPase